MKYLSLLIVILCSFIARADNNFGNLYVAPLEDPAQEARATQLGTSIKCSICSGQSIEESRASLAADMKKLIRQQIKDGKTDAQIVDFLRSSYGDVIFLKPPVSINSILVWLAPILILLLSGALFFRNFFGKKIRKED